MAPNTPCHYSVPSDHGNHDIALAPAIRTAGLRTQLALEDEITFELAEHHVSFAVCWRGGEMWDGWMARTHVGTRDRREADGRHEGEEHHDTELPE